MDWVAEMVSNFFTRPPEWLEAVTRWLTILMAVLIVFLMIYSCAAAH